MESPSALSYDFSIELVAPAKAPPAQAAPVQRDISATRALVVDGQPGSRSLLMAQLRDIGVGMVKHAACPSDARVLLERGAYDFVFCEASFPDPDESGHDLLEELRRERLLPYGTAFIMVTAEADYGAVREAAESVVDGYLLRPYSTQNLSDRVHEARRRKQALADVYAAVEAGRTDHAIELAMARVTAKGSYWRLCARLAAELLLQAERLDEAVDLLQSLAEDSTMGWARLALSRARAARGETALARREIETLVKDSPDYADAYDVLGMLQVDQGEFAGALETYRTASRLTPGCLLRQQHNGTLAFYAGASEEALRCLERVVALGLESRLFDALTLALLALCGHDLGQAKAVSRALEQLQAFQRRHPGSARLRRMTLVPLTLEALGNGDMAAARAGFQRLAGEHRSDSFDVEAATLLLALAARMPADLRHEPELTSLRQDLARRCCVSRVVSDILVMAAGRDPQTAEIILTAHAEIHGIAERAVAMSARQRPRQAIKLLLERGRATLNAKLIDMAAMIAVRHRAALEDADAMLDLISQLQERYCRPVTHLAGVMRARRPPGALALRGQPAVTRRRPSA
ncbi:response regulator [Rubrivivax albus]|uniref:Response regulator n=1 Tax=Rubrivivax albus TaxID=2499835 RepID=A0A3S2VZT9_9BURK|nr:response regulator [Rubrivivax albus]RVT54214.1 response regulator [Rubrivivax albus]